LYLAQQEARAPSMAAAGVWDVAASSSEASASLPDTAAFLALLARLRAGGAASEEERAAAALFAWDAEVVVSRAPGRMDVMGGIADYSGSLVLQMPIAEACHAAAQLGPGDGMLTVVSLGGATGARASVFSLPASALLEGGAPVSYEAARRALSGDAATRWAAYPLGAAHVLAKEGGADWSRTGLRVLLSSAVPEVRPLCCADEFGASKHRTRTRSPLTKRRTAVFALLQGKGVSSSAAVEVATMSAAAALAGVTLDGRTLALWCQLAENRVVGAPCGVMDQMASSLGRAGELLALLCRPAEVQGTVALGAHAGVWGIDSGIRHSVGGSDYGAVRAGTFMARTIVGTLAPAARADASAAAAAPARVPPASAAAAAGGPAYLTAVPPHEFERAYSAALPERMTGAAFGAAHGSHGDDITPLCDATSYAVRTPAAHAVYEHFRVSAFQLALAAPPGDAQLALLGQLMHQSHESYNRCGLGSSGTDALVALVEELGPSRGLFGAKITGGGCGGTVCVLGRADAADAVHEVARRYAAASGTTPHVFTGSSPGAAAFGVLRLTPKKA
jgi:L-arabinokinase